MTFLNFAKSKIYNIIDSWGSFRFVKPKRVYPLKKGEKMGENTVPQKSSDNAGSIVALMVALLVAIFAFQLNASMLSPALVTMQTQLHTTASSIALTQTIFFTAAALFALFLPRLADLIGRKKVLIGMLTLTMIGCLISGFATNVGILMIGRILQGAAGPVVPLCLIILHVKVRDEKRYAKLMAILTSINGGIAGVDALAGGWLVSHGGFRSVFFVMGITAALAILLVSFGTQESTAKDTPKMDWSGVILLVVAMGALLSAVNALQGSFGNLGLPNWLLASLLALLGLICFVGFWQVEKRVNHPMVPIHYLKQRRTWGLLITTLLTMTGVFAIMNGIIPALGQDGKIGLGLGADMVSLVTLTPYALAGLFFGPVSGFLAARFGFTKVLRVGLLTTIIGIGLAVAGVLQPSIWLLLLVSTFIGITYAGITNIMLNGLGIVLSPEDNPGYLPGLNAGMFNLGAGISFIILYAVPTLLHTSVGGSSSGYISGIVTGLILVIIAFFTSFLIPDSKNVK